MDWSNERYVRLYIRDTTTWKRLGWDGQNMLMQLLRKVDRSGMLDLDGLEAWEAAMLHTGAPEEAARAGIAAMLRVGAIELLGTSLVFPNFVDAQECVKSETLRSREYRERRARGAPITDSDEPSQSVTPESRTVSPPSLVDQARHEPSRGVTPYCAVPSVPSVPSVPYGAEPSLAKQEEIAPGSPPAARKSRPKSDGPSPGSLAWDAYALAYAERYGPAPIRNQTTNSQLAAFVKRVPAEEAPGIARHYLRSSQSRYVAAKHPVGMLLQDAEKLRTEWATATHTTSFAAREADKRAGRGEAHNEMLAQIRAEEAAGRRLGS